MLYAKFYRGEATEHQSDAQFFMCTLICIHVCEGYILPAEHAKSIERRKIMKKKVLSLVLASAMVVSMAACGSSDAPVSSEASSSESVAQSSSSEESTAAEAPKSMAEQIEGMSYDEASTYLFNANMGDYYEAYLAAKDIVDDVDLRWASMAIAEAKLMEDAVLMPFQCRGGNYAISRVAPRTVTPVLYGNDSDRFHQAIITTEPILATDREEMLAKYAELKGTGTYEAWAKEYLTGKGYELTDTYKYFDYDEDPQNWDILATSRAVDNEVLVNTFDGLMEYDVEGVLQPALAESYEVSADGLTYTFKIREGAVWTDSQGRKVADVCADDFVAGMQHMLDACGGLESLVYGVIANAQEYVEGTVTDFAEVGVKATDDYTVEYTLAAPCPYFMTMLGYSIFAPMSRTYYESMGGKFGAEFDNSAASYTYAKDKDSIAYCGPYLITNYTAGNTIVFTASESYWNAANINIHNLTWVWEDGSDPLKIYNDIKSGVIAGAGLNSSALEVAKQDGWFDQYAYVSDTDATSFCGFLNLHRGIFANFNDATAAVSPQTEEDAARTFEAVNNVHFRRALLSSMDRASYMACVVGEDLKYNRIVNSYTPGTFVSLANDVTVDINGTATTFKAGTAYGEIMQAQIDADGVAIKVWDADKQNSTGFDGWYNPENAAAELEIAIAELAEIGVTVDASNPIQIDWPYNASVETTVNRVNAVKQSVEAALGGKVVLNLVACPDANTLNNTGYFAEVGSDMNYDFSDGSGWGPDYGDPQTYLDTILPDYEGYMTKSIGVF